PLRDQVVESFDVAFRWAPGVPSPRADVPDLEFPVGALSVIRRIAKGLRQDEDDREQVVYGWVETLTSKPGDIGGRVLVQAMIDGKQRVIRMSLSADDYEKAYASHKHSSVVVKGILHIEEGKQLYMDVSAFDLEQTLPVALQPPESAR